MPDQGCEVLTAQNIIDGTVTVTPSASPISGTARLTWSRTILKKLKTFESVRSAVVAPDPTKLLITLEKSDQAGHKLCWTSYE